ncbi:ATP-binding cassette domain-containing protein [Lactococcus fujiensis]|uniref:ATP-binding cassette domain-containing protein n=1 Tax=Lactococcus fujiensis TaxID=610251 RepID=UPI0006D24B7D|nr:ATP-binding cassette domain-containing protein [Lactococcus fujiensis]
MEIKNLSKSIDNVKILEDINLSIPKGIIYGIVGRNGSGKTTLFRSLASHYLLDEGEIIINQQNINEFPHLKNDFFI